jgi:phage repressor protein C with HTH and peptisase S24 domain
MYLDPARRLLAALIAQHEVEMKYLSEQVLKKNHAYIQQYLTRNSPANLKEQERELLGEYFGVSPDLFRPEGDPKREVAAEISAPGQDALALVGDLDTLSIKGVEYVAVGRYDAEFAAGPGSIIQPDECPEAYMLFEAQWLRMITSSAADNLAVVRIRGDSMVDTLNDGDYVLIDRLQTKLTREGVYAMRVGESCWIKRLSLNLKKKLIRIISDNNRYPIQELDEADIELIGRVVWIVGRRVP